MDSTGMDGSWAGLLMRAFVGLIMGRSGVLDALGMESGLIVISLIVSE